MPFLYAMWYIKIRADRTFWGIEIKRQVNAVAYEKLLNEIYAAVSLKYLWKEYQPYCVKKIYVCNYKTNTIEPIVLPQNAETFLNTEAEYLRYCHDWEDGMALDL